MLVCSQQSFFGVVKHLLRRIRNQGWSLFLPLKHNSYLFGSGLSLLSGSGLLSLSSPELTFGCRCFIIAANRTWFQDVDHEDEEGFHCFR